MAVTYYSEDEDLLKVRPNILSLGVGSWEEQHLEAFAIINRTLISRWYKSMAASYNVNWLLTEFDPDLVDTDQLKRLSVYKTLELAYLYLAKDSPEEDGFERHSKTFANRYSQELQDLLSIGISYDWDGDDTIETEEKYATQPRRNLRA